MLFQPLYRGEVVWNRQRKRDQWGVKRYLNRPEEQWIRIPAPDLRIVPEDLWQAAHRRLDRTRQMYAGTGTRPPLDRRRTDYLLSGLAKCGECGGSLVAFTNEIKGGRRTLYGCMYHHKRGAKVCSNPILIRQEKLDRVVIEAIVEELDERLLERAVEKALQRLRRQPESTKDRRAVIKAELPLLEARMRTVVDEIARGYATDTLRAELHDAEQRKRALVGELEALTGRRQETASRDVDRLRRELRRHVAEIRGLLGKDIPRTRQILRKLLVGPLECHPFDEKGRRGYRFTGQGSYTELVPVIVTNANHNRGRW
jgi:site-specific DNA recombinase